MKTMYRLPATILLCLTLCLTALPSSAQASDVLQRDWMIALVDALGWSFGLPDEPTDDDYIGILAGGRQFRFEAEQVYAKAEDDAAMMPFTNFGPFSGEGWLQSTAKVTTLHLRFTLPLPGTYRLSAAIRDAGHVFEINGERFEGDGAERFETVELGAITLPSGPQELVVTMPPRGAIDYIDLRAPNHAVIMPAGGWVPDAPLTWQDIHFTVAQALDLSPLLASTPERILIEAEDFAQSPDTQSVAMPHLGEASGDLWLRAGSRPVLVPFPLAVKQGGFYRITLRTLGRGLTLTLNDHLAIEVNGPPYLETQELGPYFLTSGDNTLAIDLLPGTGVDSIRLTALSARRDDLATLLGIAPQSGTPGPADLNQLVTQLAAFGTSR